MQLSRNINVMSFTSISSVTSRYSQLYRAEYTSVSLVLSYSVVFLRIKKKCPKHDTTHSSWKKFHSERYLLKYGPGRFLCLRRYHNIKARIRRAVMQRPHLIPGYHTPCFYQLQDARINAPQRTVNYITFPLSLSLFVSFPARI